MKKNDGKKNAAKRNPSATLESWKKFKREQDERRQNQQTQPVVSEQQSPPITEKQQMKSVTQSRTAPPLKPPRPKLSKAKRWRLTWQIIVIILFFGTILGGLIYHVSPEAKIADVSVTGVKLTAAQDIIDASHLSGQDYVSITWLHRQRTAATIKQKLPALKQVTLKFNQWNKVEIAVKEHQTVGFFAKKDGYQRVLSNGYVDDEVLAKPLGNFPVYDGFKLGQSLNRIIKLYAKMPNQIQNAISEIKADPSKTNPYRIHMYMNDGNEVVADSRTVINRLKYYGNIVAQTKKKGIVDLEVGAYFVPFDEKK
ncbi:cell division protein FtsQ/DivIB [Lapidilactobacillus bayanensis]|uniref:cell division protein FtsQ/DivIB n=1 Tax=Lapidilactobacillus bayanensis TaxID=2485998 RepID=UPI000F77518E|nr:cell division protein FtsQ/DivIB [Lapidilactobacillus bayanensis]